jgi:kynureninase
MATFQPTREAALALDADDELASYRDQFYLPRVHAKGQQVVYLCGHSLGLQPQIVRDYIDEELQDWATWGVEGHFKARRPWLSYHETLSAQTARLVGAKPAEVVVMNSLTVNLHLMLVSFYRPTPERCKILIEADTFPSDRYAVESHLKWHGYDPRAALLTLQPRPGEVAVRQEDIAALLHREGESIALIWLGGVNYYTGQVFDMANITTIGHAQGCVVGFDLAHAAGNIVLQLHDWDVDCAVWCSYKYLNGGPGAVAGCFVHERYANRPDLPRLAGWWGHNKDTRFQMPVDFDPIPGAEGWQISNPPIFQLAALRASMSLFDRVGMAALRAKSERLTGYLAYLIGNRALPGVTLMTPDDPAQRGAQLSLQIKRHGRALHQRLTEAHIICDWREPDVIRVAPVPLYNTFLDVFTFVNALDTAHREVLVSS